MDILFVSEKVYLLTMTGDDRDRPAYKLKTLFKPSEKSYPGGGDWNGDGVPDLVLTMKRGGWQTYHYKLLPGFYQPHGGLRFKVPQDRWDGKKLQHWGIYNWRSEVAINKSLDALLAKYDQSDPVQRKELDAAYYRSDRGVVQRAVRSPWAWDFTGTAKRRGVIQYVGLGNIPDLNWRKKSPQANKRVNFRDRKFAGPINLYEIKDGTTRHVAVLVKTGTRVPLLCLEDFNRDGCMDLIYGGGRLPEETKIHVMYGKIQNVNPGTLPWWRD